MNTNTCIRITELFVYVFIVVTYATGYDVGSTTAAVDLFLYLVLLATNIQKFVTYETGTDERDTQKKITLFSIFHIIFIVLNHVVYLIFYGADTMSLNGTKTLTWIWYVLNFASLLTLLVQLFYRLLSIMVKPEYIKL
jgi:hypothetical protein